MPPSFPSPGPSGCRTVRSSRPTSTSDSPARQRWTDISGQQAHGYDLVVEFAEQAYQELLEVLFDTGGFLLGKVLGGLGLNIDPATPFSGRWLVNGSYKGLVKLTVDPAVQAKMWKRSATLRELWISVTDPDALIAACAATS